MTMTISSPVIQIRWAQLGDFHRVWEIIEDARQLLKADGSDQWQAGYPDQATVRRDVLNGHCLVLVVGNQIAGTISLNPAGDPHYRDLVTGKWARPDAEYVTIHRLAVDQNFRGQQLAHRLLKAAIDAGRRPGAVSLRLATHDQNDRIHRLVQSMGFVYRGIVQTSPIDQRAAYELLLA